MRSLSLPGMIAPPNLQPAERRYVALTGAARDALFTRLAAAAPGPHGWLPGDGGLIANLRVWENCLLPLRYFADTNASDDEARFSRLLATLLELEADLAAFAATPAGKLNRQQRRLVCGLRTLLVRPALILAESGWFAEWSEPDVVRWQALFASECPQSAWLVAGPQPPATAWRCVSETPEDTHVAAA